MYQVEQFNLLEIRKKRRQIGLTLFLMRTLIAYKLINKS